jgi:NTP pyrophosphatase (non-canonical NTP hydrolase)
MNVQEIQQKVDEWISVHGGYWPPLSMLAAIIEELGEVAREINAINGPKVKKTPEDDLAKLKEELADLLFALICMNNYYQIDMEAEILAVLSKYEQRDASRFTSLDE